MFATAYVVDMPGGGREAALVGIGELSDENAEIDDRVFYYFESLDEIANEHTGWGPDTWFIVTGLELPCYVCGMFEDGGCTVSTIEHAPDNYGDPIELETVVKCKECRRDYI